MPRKSYAQPYRMMDHEQTAQRGAPGFEILKKSARARVEKPSWHCTHNVVRVLPGRDRDDTSKLGPFADSPAPHDCGDWIRSYMTVTLGEPPKTFILSDPRDQTVPPHANPAVMLQAAIFKAVRAGQGLPHWTPLVLEKTRGPLQIARAKAFMQCIVFMRNNKTLTPPLGSNAQEDTVVYVVSDSVCRSIMSAFDENRDSDFVSLDQGAYLHIYEEGAPPLQGHGPVPGQMPGGALQAPPAPSWGTGAPARGGTVSNYAVDFLPTFNQCSANISGLPGVEQIVQHWDDILYIPTVEEQVQLIVQSGIPADAIAYGLGDMYWDQLPDSVRQARPNMGAQTQGWAPPQAQAPQQPPQQQPQQQVPFQPPQQAAQPSPPAWAPPQAQTPQQPQQPPQQVPQQAPQQAAQPSPPAWAPPQAQAPQQSPQQPQQQPPADAPTPQYVLDNTLPPFGGDGSTHMVPAGPPEGAKPAMMGQVADTPPVQQEGASAEVDEQRRQAAVAKAMERARSRTQNG